MAQTVLGAQTTAKYEFKSSDKVRTLLGFGAFDIRMGKFKDAVIQLQSALDFKEAGAAYLSGEARGAAMDLLQFAKLRDAGQPIPADLATRAPVLGIE